MAMNTPLKAWRTSANKSAEEVATALGVTLGMLSRWETGSRRVPAERVLEVERITGISRHALRPDIYGPAPQGAAA